MGEVSPFDVVVYGACEDSVVSCHVYYGVHCHPFYVVSTEETSG